MVLFVQSHMQGKYIVQGHVIASLVYGNTTVDVFARIAADEHIVPKHVRQQIELVEKVVHRIVQGRSEYDSAPFKVHTTTSTSSESFSKRIHQFNPRMDGAC